MEYLVLTTLTTDKAGNNYNSTWVQCSPKHQFYASLHHEKQQSKVPVPSHDNQDFSGSACDLVRSMALDVYEPIEEGNSSEPNIIDDIPELTSKIDEYKKQNAGHYTNSSNYEDLLEKVLRPYPT